MSFDLAPTLENPLWPVIIAIALVIIHLVRPKNETVDTNTKLINILSFLGKSKIPIVGAIAAYIISNTNLLQGLSEIWNKLGGKLNDEETPKPPKQEEK